MSFDWGSAIGGGVASLISSERTRDVNARSAADQRQAEEREAEKSRGFSSAEAAISRDWSERMAGSAHQREIADLQAAGLNPILSGTGGMGAASSGGVMASSAKAAAALGAPSPDYGRVVSSALDARKNKAEVRNLEEATEQIYADTQQKKQDAVLKSYDMNVRKAQERLLMQQELTERENTSTAKQNALILSEQLKGAKIEGGIDETTWGKILRWTDRHIKSLTPFGRGGAFGRQ